VMIGQEILPDRCFDSSLCDQSGMVDKSQRQKQDDAECGASHVLIDLSILVRKADGDFP